MTAYGVTQVDVTKSTDVRAIWSWDDGAVYNYLEVEAIKGTSVSPKSTDAIALVTWVRDFGDGPEIYASGFAMPTSSQFKTPSKSVDSARVNMVVPFTYGAPGNAVLNLAWTGTGELVIDNWTKIGTYDPLTGVRTVARDRFTGRFATVSGTVALPELGSIDVATLPTDEYYPPFMIYSAATSVQVIK